VTDSSPRPLLNESSQVDGGRCHGIGCADVEYVAEGPGLGRAKFLCGECLQAWQEVKPREDNKKAKATSLGPMTIQYWLLTLHGDAMDAGPPRSSRRFRTRSSASAAHKIQARLLSPHASRDHDATRPHAEGGHSVIKLLGVSGPNFLAIGGTRGRRSFPQISGVPALPRGSALDELGNSRGPAGAVCWDEAPGGDIAQLAITGASCSTCEAFTLQRPGHWYRSPYKHKREALLAAWFGPGISRGGQAVRVKGMG